MFKALLEQITKRVCERDAVGVLQVMDDLAKSVGKENRGAREFERMLADSAQAAQAFNRRRRIATLRADGLRNGNEARPAVRARGSVAALEHARSTDHAGSREKNV